jgi:hypothetical protein
MGRRNGAVTLGLLMIALLAPAGAGAQTTTEQRALDAYEGLPLDFAANAGQTDERVRYLAHGDGTSFFFTDAGAMLAFAPGDEAGSSALALGLRFPGAAPGVSPHAGGPATGAVSRFTGAGGDQQAAYGELTYRELWPGIDLVVSGDDGELTYEFHVGPGADPGDIRLAYAGADGLSAGADGDLVVHTPLGELTEGRPQAYQDQAPVESRHVLRGDGEHGFALDGDYDRGRALVIRARLVYSTFVGGAGADSGRGVAVDAHGSAYVAGQTASADFPTTPGVFDRSYNQNTDAFVTKFDPAGTAIVYSTFVGGTAFDSANAIAADGDGAAYIAGFTGSTNFPTTPGAFDPTHNGGSEAFVAKLSPSGSALEYSSYLGAGGFAFDGANGIAVDDEGSAYVTGFAGGADFPTTPGAFDRSHNGSNDVYVTKFDPSGSALVYSTFVGGTRLDTGNAIAVDRDGSAYVTGITASGDFPTSEDAPDRTHGGGGNDAFVTKLDASGSAIVYSTLLGGAGNDAGQGIAVDEQGKAAHVAGSTGSSDFPTSAGAFDESYNGGGDAFVTKLDRDGTAFVYSTFLGGTAADAASGIAVDEKAKAAFVTGTTESDDLPTTADAIDRSSNGGGDAFVAGLDRKGALGYATYLGGAGSDAGLGIAVHEKSRAAYVTGSNGAGDATLTKLAIGPGGSAGR